MKLMKRYLRRHWKPLFRAPARIIAWCAAIYCAQVLLWMEPNGWSLVACIAIYGIYAVTEAIKNIRPSMTFQHMQAEEFVLESGPQSINQETLDKMIRAAVKAQLSKAGE